MKIFYRIFYNTVLCYILSYQNSLTQNILFKAFVSGLLSLSLFWPFKSSSSKLSISMISSKNSLKTPGWFQYSFCVLNMLSHIYHFYIIQSTTLPVISSISSTGSTYTSNHATFIYSHVHAQRLLNTRASQVVLVIKKKKKQTCQCRRHKRHRFNPCLGRTFGEGHGNPLQYS